MGIFSDILLTVDYDRTLTAPDSTIPERNIEAIRYFMENGGAFTVNTGRSMPMAAAFMDKVPVNAPLLLYNGSAAYDTEKKEICFMHEIDLDLWQTIKEVAAMYPDLSLEVQALDKHYNFKHDPAWDAFSANNCAYATAQEGQDLGPFLKFSIYGEIREVTVDHLFRGTPEEIRYLDGVQAAVTKRYADKIVAFRAGPRIIDFHTKGVSKARSARELQQKLGKKLLVCVGDGENDVSMLREADFAYSPADGVAADRFPNVCPCAEGSVADVIYRKIPQILNFELDKRV